MSGVRHLTVSEDEADQRLDRWFRRRFPDVPHGRLERMLRKGEIRVDGGRAKAADRLHPGQSVRVPPLPVADDSPAPASARPARDAPAILSGADGEFIRSLVLFRDGYVIAINKPPGLPSQGGSGQHRHVDGMLGGLCYERQDRPRLVHRLDKDTSGVLLLGRTPMAAANLSAALRSRAARKTYWAAVVGAPKPPAGTIKTTLVKDSLRGPNEKMRVAPWEEAAQIDGAKRAITDYASIESLSDRTSWLALRPVTGRTHQLRAHMGAIGHPIVGDGKYRGERESVSLGGAVSGKLHLHARRIEIPHPKTGAPLIVEAPLPDHMRKSWAALGWSIETEAADDPFAELDARLRGARA